MSYWKNTVKNETGDSAELLLKAMLRVLAGSSALFAMVIFLPVFFEFERTFLAEMVVILFFIALITWTCYVVFRMTLGGQNIFTLPAYLLLRLCGKNLRQVQALEPPFWGRCAMLAGLVTLVALLISLKIPDKGLALIVGAATLYFLLTLCCWKRLRGKHDSDVLGEGEPP